MREASPRIERSGSPEQYAPVDSKRARRQHAQLLEGLKDLGIDMQLLPALPDNSESIFVGDGAVIVPDVAVIARASGSHRQSEADAIAAMLARYRPVVRVVAPAMLNGSDVLRVGRTLFVRLSSRTNAEAVTALAESVDAYGYDVRTVELEGDVRLKAACAFIPPHTLLLNPRWISPAGFSDFNVVTVEEDEPFAADTLTVAGITMIDATASKTEKRLHDAGIQTRRIDLSEFQKIGGGLSSLTLVMEPRVARPDAAPRGLRVVQPAPSATTTGFFAPAVVHGDVVYVSGQLPLDPDTGRPVSGELEEQTEQALRNLSAVLGASGSGLPFVLRLTFYVADPKSVDRVSAVCAKVLNGHKPAGSIVPAKSLLHGCSVAVDAIAAVADQR